MPVMTDEFTHALLERTPEEQVEDWREQRLLDAGFSFADALTLARCPWVDLHEATDLVERGCPGGLATEILL